MLQPALLAALLTTAAAQTTPNVNAPLIQSVPQEVEVRFGGTLGLTGKYAATARQSSQGIQLVQETINSDPSLYTRMNGDQYKVIFDIVDDQSRSEKVREEYTRLATDERYVAVIGPYSSELSMVAAEAVNATGSGSVMMFHAGSNPSIYERRFPNLFSVNLLATDYFASALKLLYERGARTVSLAEGSQDFHRALCQGARDHALRIGYRLLSQVSIAGSDISEGINNISKYSPDVFVGCGHLHNAVQVTVTSRALTFNPKALVVAQATGDDFVNKVLARNALYVLGPLIWHRSVQQRCEVFGSAQDFDKRYLKRFGEAPSYQAALAAGAAIALFRAMEWSDRNLNALDKEGLAEAMSAGLVVDTVCGSLNFSTVTGLRIGGKGFTQQFMPVPIAGENMTMMDRYTRLSAALLQKAEQVVYPAPSWEMKELEIYPCPLGQTLTVEENTCVPCPVGTYRDDDSVTCRTCPGGTYGLLPGLYECKSCSNGMDCGGNRSTSGAMLAREGWYFVDTSQRYIPCQPSWVCLGGNQCSEGQAGSFCGKCSKGYTNGGPWSTGTAACTECPSWIWNLLGLLGVVVYAKLVFKLLLHSHKASIGSVTALHTIIMRIVYNYSSLVTTFIVASGGLQRHIGYRVLIAMFLDPFRYFLSLDCTMGGGGGSDRTFLVGVVLALFLLPCLLLMSFFGILGTAVLHLVFTQEAVPTTPPPRERTDLDEVMAARASAESQEDDLERSTEVEEAKQKVLVSQRARGAVGKTRTLSRPHFDLTMEEVTVIVDDVKRRFVNKALVWMFLTYPIIVHMLLDGAICVDKDVLRLEVDVDLVCQSPEHVQWFRLCVFGLMMYGLGIPGYIFFQLYRIRNKLLDLTVRRHYGFIYNGFEPNYYYYESIYMIRTLLVQLSLAIPTKTLRFLVMVALGLFFLGLHIRCEPFDDRDFFVLDRLEILSLTAFLFSCLAGLWFSYLENLPDSLPGFIEFSRSDGFAAAITTLVAICHAGFLLMAVWGLVRNLILKHFRFLEECFPEHLSPIQKCILQVLDGRCHHVKLNPDTRELDISGLSSDERRFLQSALSDTMAAYITAAVRPDPEEKGKPGRRRRSRKPIDDDSVDYHRFYTGHMVAALRLAYKRVEYSRLRRAEEYESALAKSGSERSSWLAKSAKRFKALLVASYSTASNEIRHHVHGPLHLRENLANSRFVSWMRRPPHTVLDLSREQTEMGASVSAEKRAAASMHQLGVSVEELHLGLMLSWMDIALGRDEYFILETAEDRERAFEREVLAAKGTTWTEDETFLRLFKSLDLRKRLAMANQTGVKETLFDDEEEEGKPQEEDGPDVVKLLGKPATHEQADAKALRRDHAELVVEVLELQTQLRKLQKQMATLMSESQAPSQSRRSSEDDSREEEEEEAPECREARTTRRQSQALQSRVSSRLSTADTQSDRPQAPSQAASLHSRSSSDSRQGSAPPTLRTSAAAGKTIQEEEQPAIPAADGSGEPAVAPTNGVRLPLQTISAWPTEGALAAARASMRSRSVPPTSSRADNPQPPVHSRDSTGSNDVGEEPPRAAALFSALIPRGDGKLASMGRMLELRAATAAAGHQAAPPPVPVQPLPPVPPPVWH